MHAGSVLFAFRLFYMFFIEMIWCSISWKESLFSFFFYIYCIQQVLKKLV